MTERSTIRTEKVPASERTAPGFATKVTRRASSGARRAPVSAEERECMIAMAAYYRAERRGFAPGRELEDWYEAAAEIDRRLGSRSA